MALQQEVFSFTGNGAGTQTVSLQDSSITPKLIIICGPRANVTTTHRWTFGASDGTNDFCSSWTNDLDGAADMDCHVGFSASNVLETWSPTGTAESAATISATAAGSFSLSWGTVSTAVFDYIVVGGDDILVQVGTDTTATSVTTKATTTTFQPKCVILVSNVRTTAGNGDGSWAGGIGAMDGVAEFAASSQEEDAAATMDNRRRNVTFGSLQLMTDSGATRNQSSFSAFGATSFTLSCSTSDGVAYQFGWIALGGSAQYRVRATATAGTTDVNWSSAMKASIVLAAWSGTIGGPVEAHALLGFGAATASAQRSYNVVSENAGLTVDVAREGSATSFMHMLASAADGTDAVVADVTSFDNDGITVNYSVDDTLLRRFGLIGIAPAIYNYYLGGNAMNRGERGIGWAA